MKRKVYQCVTNEYIEMEVLARYKYIGKSDAFRFINGKIYDCVGYRDEKRVILVDETGEDYTYILDGNFVLIEDYKK